MLPPALKTLRDALVAKTVIKRSSEEDKQLAELERVDSILEALTKKTPSTRGMVLGELQVTKSFGGGGGCYCCGR